MQTWPTIYIPSQIQVPRNHTISTTVSRPPTRCTQVCHVTSYYSRSSNRTRRSFGTNTKKVFFLSMRTITDITSSRARSPSPVSLIPPPSRLIRQNTDLVPLCSTLFHVVPRSIFPISCSCSPGKRERGRRKEKGKGEWTGE